MLMKPAGPDIGKSALVIVDMQNDFVHPHGGFASMARERSVTTWWSRRPLRPRDHDRRRSRSYARRTSLGGDRFHARVFDVRPCPVLAPFR